MTTQRKITVTFLDLDTARTTGWPLRFVARQLGLWDNRTDIEIHNLLQNGLDRTKFKLSTVWVADRKTARVFATGHSISEQLDTIMTELAGDGDNDVEIEFFKLADNVQFRLIEQTDFDLWRTITSNIDPRWFGTLEDRNHLTSFNSRREATRLPLLPSAQNRVLRSGFDTEMTVPKTLIE